MKLTFKLTSLFISICLFIGIFSFSTFAKKSIVIDLGKNNIKVGEDVTVKITVNADKKMYAAGFYLEYDETILKYKKGNGISDAAGVLHIEESFSGQTSFLTELTFSAIKAGSFFIQVTDCGYEIKDKTGAKPVNLGGASAKITVVDKSLSSNSKLKSLKVIGYSLSPSFSPKKTSYKVTVPYDVEKINVIAKTDDADAKVKSVDGNNKLSVGKNTVTVSVEAPDGSLKKYTIYVTRLTEQESYNSDNTSAESEKEKPLKTTIEDTEYLIATKIPQDILFKGFTTQTTQVNGFDIETAVDSEGNFRIFYLSASDSEELIPYLYDEDTDEFQKLKYYIFGENYYIFSQIPDEYNVPDNLYASNVNIGGFSVDCLSDTNTEMSDYHYLYCYSNGAFNLYRFDSLEGTLQRYPDFEKLVSSNSSDSKDNIFSRFSSLSTNGKVILLAFIIVILGIFALLIMLIVYLIKRSINNSDDFILSSDYDDFDQIDLQSDTTMRK